MTDIDKFFDYTELLEDRKVKFVVYRLKGGALVWWERLRETRLRERHGPVQTWKRMKPLLQVRFLPSDHE